MVHGPITKNTSLWAPGLMQIRVGNSADNIATIAPVLTSTHSIGALANTKIVSTPEYFKIKSGFPVMIDGIIPLKEDCAAQCAFREISPYNMALARGIDPTASVDPTATADVAINSTAGTTASSSLSITVSGTGYAAINEEWTVVFTGAAAGSIFGKTTGHVHDFISLASAMEPTDGADKYFTIPANWFTGTWVADDTYVFYTSAGGTSTYASAHSGSIGLGNLVAPADVRVECVYTFPNGTNTITTIFPRAQVMEGFEFEPGEEDPAAIALAFNSLNASSENDDGNAVWDSMPLGKMIWA